MTVLRLIQREVFSFIIAKSFLDDFCFAALAFSCLFFCIHVCCMSDGMAQHQLRPPTAQHSMSRSGLCVGDSRLCFFIERWIHGRHIVDIEPRQHGASTAIERQARGTTGRGGCAGGGFRSQAARAHCLLPASHHDSF